MTLLRIDQRFIEALEDIVFDVAEPEASDLCTDASNEIIAAGGREHPVKEIRFNHAADACILKDLAGEQVGGRGKLSAEDQRRHGLGNDSQVAVLEEQGIIVDAGAIDEAKPLGPQLALEHDIGKVLDLRPKRFNP